MRLLEERFTFSALILMVQLEVALRMLAFRGLKIIALSIGVQYFCHPTLIKVVPLRFIVRVESAIIKLEKKHPAVEVFDERVFFSLVGCFWSKDEKHCLIP